jgi:hypothetical protein
LRERGRVVIPYRYAEQWLTHGYAVTIIASIWLVGKHQI